MLMISLCEAIFLLIAIMYEISAARKCGNEVLLFLCSPGVHRELLSSMTSLLEWESLPLCCVSMTYKLNSLHVRLPAKGNSFTVSRSVGYHFVEQVTRMPSRTPSSIGSSTLSLCVHDEIISFL